MLSVILADSTYSFNLVMLIVWASILLLSIIIEAATVEVVSIWFAIASLVCLLINFIPGIPFWVEIIIFLVLSIILLLALRPIASKMLSRRKSETNIDTLINKEVKLLNAIDEDHNGEVKIGDLIYTAVSEKNDKIEKGTLVKIVSISGNKLYVVKVD